MAHIDEGTIHAWLDGALSPDEGGRLEAHIDGCAECSAAVAEARGLIAASTRILLSLDDVPAGVIPRAIDRAGERGSAGEVERPRDRTGEPGQEHEGERAARRDADVQAPRSPEIPRVARDGVPLRRPWYIRPQFAAAAAVAFVAISATLVVRRTDNRSAADFQGTSAAEMSPDVAPMAAAQAGLVDSQATASRTRDAVAASVAPSAAGASGAAAVREEAAKSIAAPADSTVPTPRPLALSPDVITSAERARVRGDAALQQKREAEAPPAAGGRAAPAPAVTSVPTAPPAAPAAAAPAPPSALAGCYRLEPVDSLRLAGVGERWQLEFVPAGAEGEVATYVARALPPSNAMRDERAVAAAERSPWRWAPMPGGQLLLLRGTGATAARYVLNASVEGDAANRLARDQRSDAPVAASALRITCPTP